MLEQRIQQHFIDSADLKYQSAQGLEAPISAAVQAMLACITGGGKMLACGSGVSAAQAQMFAALCVCGFERDRPELAALAGYESRDDRTAAFDFLFDLQQICAAALEGAREGKTVEDVMKDAATVLTREDVMEGVAEMIPFVQLEAIFTDGSRLVTVHEPIR